MKRIEYVSVFSITSVLVACGAPDATESIGEQQEAVAVPRADDILTISRQAGLSNYLGRSDHDGTFTFSTPNTGSFQDWTRQSNVAVAGDFDNNGRTDVALLAGPSGWRSVPVAFFSGGSNVTVTNVDIGDFAVWSGAAKDRLVGDFNADGFGDIALVGGNGWSSVPVALSNGNGSFTVQNFTLTNFGSWAADASASRLVGDFNSDGRSDIALVGGNGWGSIPVALSTGGGFTIVNGANADFASWAVGTPRFIGDFNGDGRADIALTGRVGWNSIPVAYSNGDGTFRVVNNAVTNFGAWSAQANVTRLAADFNGDNYTDIVLTGGIGWGSIPVALGQPNGFLIRNQNVTSFPGWAAKRSGRTTSGGVSGVLPVVADYNMDFKADIALFEVHCNTGCGFGGVNGVPIAHGAGDGFFSVTNPVDVPGNGVLSIEANRASQLLTGNF